MIFHLAGVVSGEAELDFDKGYRVNLDGTRALLEAIRAAGDGYRPKLVYTSSIAVFGAPFPDDDPRRLSSHAAHLLRHPEGDLRVLLADYTRRGFCDGVGIRLPTIVVRPGQPNRAASGFFSGIIREPLAGVEAVLPVAGTVAHTHASPRSAVGFLVHAAGLSAKQLGARINLSMPGVSARWPSRSRRCAASPASGSPAASGASPIALVRTHRRRLAATHRCAPRRELGFRPRRRSTRSCAFTSTRTAAALSCPREWDGLTNGCSRGPCPQLAEPDVDVQRGVRVLTPTRRRAN